MFNESYEFIVCTMWTIVTAGLTVFVNHRNDLASRLLIVLTSVWIGMVIAISFHEAWIKFRAPLLSKHVGLDVGRRVFNSLNHAEAFILLNIWIISPQLTTDTIILSGILIMQIVVLTPLLNLLAEFRIVEAFAKVKDKSSDYVRQIEIKLVDKRAPDNRWHLVYVALEVIKLVLLVKYAIFTIN